MGINAVCALFVIALGVDLLFGSGRRHGVALAGSAYTIEQLWDAANDHWEHQRIDTTLELLLQIERLDSADPMLPMALGAVYQSKVRLQLFSHDTGASCYNRVCVCLLRTTMNELCRCIDAHSRD